MLYSPLEQFELVLLGPVTLLGWDVSFTNSLFYFFLVIVLVVGFLFFGLRSLFLVPSDGQLLVETIYGFVVSTRRQQAGSGAEPFFPLFFTTFIFILFANLVGLIPFSFALTGQLAVTLSLALSFNLGFIFLGFYKNGYKFLKLFVPSGVPIAVLPLIVVIEIVSYLLRTFSLSVRLFANIMAGHTLLHILTSFSTAFLGGSTPYLFMSFLPFLLVMAITFLELGIAFLQAYVFVVLLSIYLNDSLHPVHLILLIYL